MQFTSAVRHITFLVAASMAACGGGSSTYDFEPTARFSLAGGPTVPSGQYVLKNSADLQALDQYFFGERPTLDFASDMVVGVSVGPSRSCTALRITHVTFGPANVQVHYKATFTFIGSSCITPPPFASGTLGDFVVVPSSSMPVVFLDETAA